MISIVALPLAMRLSILPLFFLALPIAAQDRSDLFDKAPPAVDQALRTRISTFFQLHTEGKFRAADALVAEDSKDNFFAAQKTRYKAFEIGKITYSDNFTKAIAVVSCNSEWTFHGMRAPVVIPVTSYWKIENGDWFWYTPPPGPVQTPFGSMKYEDDAGKVPPIPANPGALAPGILGQVKASRRQVDLPSGKAAHEEVRIDNGMPGHIKLELDCKPFEGLTVSLDKTDLGAHEFATLTVDFDPVITSMKPPVLARILVSPTGQIIPVRIEFAAATPAKPN